jgi:ribonuclease PH
MNRPDSRTHDQLRPIVFDAHFSPYAEGSVLARFGDTHVLCNVTVDEELPGWLRNRAEPQGWLTAEYALLPRSTQRRVSREQRWPRGRTLEISRLIGRCLRMAVNLPDLGERQLIVDCDVLQADGGTRCAAISGGWLAVQLALDGLIAQGSVPPSVLKHQIAAVSVGLVEGQSLLDLIYVEDVAAEVDMNVVMTDAGQIVEIQGTGERAPFRRSQLDTLLELAGGGIETLLARQLEALAAARAR